MGQTAPIAVKSADTPTGATRVTLTGRIDAGRVGELYRVAVELADRGGDVTIYCEGAE